MIDWNFDTDVCFWHQTCHVLESASLTLVSALAITSGPWPLQAFSRASIAPWPVRDCCYLLCTPRAQVPSWPAMSTLVFVVSLSPRRSQILWGWDLIKYPCLEENTASRKQWNNTERKYFMTEIYIYIEKKPPTNTPPKQVGQTNKSLIIPFQALNGWSLGRCLLLSWDADPAVGQWKQVRVEGKARGGRPLTPWYLTLIPVGSEKDWGVNVKMWSRALV